MESAPIKVAKGVSPDMNPAASPGVLARFHEENKGKWLRRLPSWIVPENAFTCLRKEQMDDPANVVHRRLFALYRDRSDWNVLTYCARFADHDDPGAMARVAEAAKAMRVEGPGLSLMLDEPADIALSKIDGEWRGVWQTPDSSAPIPSPLLSITPHWVRLRGLAANRSISRFPDRLPDGGFPKPINHNPKRSNQE